VFTQTALWIGNGTYLALAYLLFAAFGAGGMLAEPFAIERVRDASGPVDPARLALAADVERNLRSPLVGIANMAKREGVDVRMPEISGFGVQEMLNEAGAALPVVFVSAHGDIRMSVRALQNGAVDFLEKPYDPQHMLDVVQAAQRTARERFDELAQRRDLLRRLDSLTSREREVLDLVVDSVPSKQIAGRLGISTKTVDVHRTRIREKTGAQSIATLVRDVLRLGPSAPGRPTRAKARPHE